MIAEEMAGAGGLTLPWDDLYFQTFFDSLDGYHPDADGTGVVNLIYSELQLYTGTTADSYATLEKMPNYLFSRWDWDKSSELRTRISFEALSSVTGNFDAVIGYMGIYQHIGFKVTNGILYGTVGNGSAETTVELQTLGASNYAIIRDLRAVFTAGSKCEFYVDGTKLGEITANLPSGDPTYPYLLFLSVTNPGVTEQKRLKLSTWTAWQEA